MPADLGQQMQDLYARFGHLSGVTIELHKELIAIRINNEQATATVFIQGAQVTHFQPRNAAPILWSSDHCQYRTGQPIRGGIPICWPWFGDLDRNPTAVQQHVQTDSVAPPNHGFVRNQDWQCDEISIVDADTTRVVFSLAISDNDEPLWPHACDLKLIITISSELTVDLSVTNKSLDTLHFTSALHSYFSVNTIENVKISGLDGSSYIDCLDDWQRKKQLGPLSISQETDRIYVTEQSTISIEEAKRPSIVLDAKGSNSTVVWNPWIEKSKRLSDYGDLDYQHMLCIETANVLDDSVALGPNQQHSLAVSISAK